MTRPLILVSNDDGVASRGLGELVDALGIVGEVVAVAPATEQSGISHAISVTRPVKIRQTGPARFAVSGTPADAVIAGLLHVCDRRPAMVVSGINHGANLGNDTFYSGTVAAAREAALRDIPALAASQALPQGFAPNHEPAHDDEVVPRLLTQAAHFTARLASWVLQRATPIDGAVLLNINAPPVTTTRFAWTTLAKNLQRQELIQRTDPRGAPYYWIGGNAPTAKEGTVGSDCWAMGEGIFSITPLGLATPVELPNTDTCQIDGYQRHG